LPLFTPLVVLRQELVLILAEEIADTFGMDVARIVEVRNVRAYRFPEV
jgi:hypothetical protein